MPNRSIRDERQGTDADGNQVTPARNKVSPPTQSAFGTASDSAPAPKAAAPAGGTNPTSDLSVNGAVKNIQQHKYALDKAIDDAG